jgi:prepilin-type N-terminal cleavage/methylation domain-containing protein/prepilin-type processing-associated H-X9-DG protein
VEVAGDANPNGGRVFDLNYRPSSEQPRGGLDMISYSSPAAGSPRTNRLGFTLVELLVVISIIGILVALLMPAVNSARESGRRAQCSNNLHQLAAACLAHETKYTFLPTGGWGYAWVGDPDRGYGKRQPGGWQYNILNFIDQNDLHDLGTGSNGDWATLTGGSMMSQFVKRSQTPVAVLNCPTRRRLQTFPYIAHPGWQMKNETTLPAVAARGDYAANAGDQSIAPNGDSGVESIQTTYVDSYNSNKSGDALPESGPLPSWATLPGGIGLGVGVASNSSPLYYGSTGPIYLHSECPMAAIKDGASYTYLLGERYVSTDFYYGGSQCDDSESWDVGFQYDINRWTAKPPAQDQAGGAQNPGDCDERFGSAHPAGFHMAFCDGSVRKMNYSIDPILHQQLGNIADGKPTQLQQVEAASSQQ